MSWVTKADLQHARCMACSHVVWRHTHQGCDICRRNWPVDAQCDLKMWEALAPLVDRWEDEARDALLANLESAQFEVVHGALRVAVIDASRVREALGKSQEAEGEF